jgi:hypothetical protein
MIDYNLEQHRAWAFKALPSRFHALFLFASADDAFAYRDTHFRHIDKRVLKRVRTVGPYICSHHDLTWIDFLRARHSMDDETIARCNDAYWRGWRTDQSELTSIGRTWRARSINEVLFYGRVDFVNRTTASDFLDDDTG